MLMIRFAGYYIMIDDNVNNVNLSLYSFDMVLTWLLIFCVNLVFCGLYQFGCTYLY